jgi:hypothetical protein
MTIFELWIVKKKVSTKANFFSRIRRRTAYHYIKKKRGMDPQKYKSKLGIHQNKDIIFVS